MQEILNQIASAFELKDTKIIEKFYADNARILPYNSTEEIVGNKNIAKAFSKAFGKQILELEIKEEINKSEMIFISGIFRDKKVDTKETFAKGTFWIVMVKDNFEYKVLAHTWSKSEI